MLGSPYLPDTWFGLRSPSRPETLDMSASDPGLLMRVTVLAERRVVFRLGQRC